LAYYIFLTEFCVVDPHPMEKSGEIMGDGQNGATPTLPLPIRQTKEKRAQTGLISSKK
jgi:hypothetical protein